METGKNILGFILLPFAFCLFILDRIFCTLLPHLDHPKFSEWIKTDNVINALLRIFTIVGMRLLFLWIFGF